MKITPRVPDEKVNYGHYSHLAEFIWLAGTIALCVAGLYFAAGLCVDFVAMRVPQEREAQWFPTTQFATAFSDAPLKDSPKVQALLDKLRVNSPTVTLPLRAYVSSSKDPNAFAVPGGGIIVTQGLLDDVRSENELSMVLGHEIGHFVHRHHLRGIGRGLVTLFVSSLLGFADGAREVADMSLSISNLSYSRSQENGADDIGLDVVEKTYGTVKSATDFFERMSKEDPSLPGVRYVLTHPLSGERVLRLHQLAKLKGYSESGEMTTW